MFITSSPALSMATASDSGLSDAALSDSAPSVYALSNYAPSEAALSEAAPSIAPTAISSKSSPKSTPAQILKEFPYFTPSIHADAMDSLPGNVLPVLARLTGGF